MSIRTFIKGITPYSLVIKRRNKQKDFAQRISKSNNIKEIKDCNPNYKTIVSVQGFGYSGSGAVLDLLREYSNSLVLGYIDPEMRSSNKNCLAEIEILRLPGGLYEIENNLNVENVYFNDALLNRTVALFENSALYKLDERIKDLFTSFFISITSQRITNLSKTYYNGYLYNPDERKDIYFLKQLSKGEYINKCRNLLTHIFNTLHNGDDYIIADQLFSDSEFNIDRNLLYVPNLKTIIVVRDPRDTYAWALKKNIEWISHHTVEEFVIWYRNQYQKIDEIKDDSRCLIIKYEDLVLNYELTVKNIEQYLGYNTNQHIKKLEYFDPKISNKFIGLYKSLPTETISIINSELRGYCNAAID